MTDIFIENESYIHKCAKEILKGWLLENYKKGHCISFDIDIKGEKQNCCCQPNREKEAAIVLEYPIINYYDDNSWDRVLDENMNIFDKKITNTPTYKDCCNIGKPPLAIIDLVILHKGSVKFGFEICHKNPVSKKKQDILQKNNCYHIYEIDALWILSQTKKPKVLKLKRQITNYKNYCYHSSDEFCIDCMTY